MKGNRVSGSIYYKIPLFLLLALFYFAFKSIITGEFILIPKLYSKTFNVNDIILRLIVIDASITSLALVFYSSIIGKYSDEEPFFISRVNLYTTSLKETFISKICPRKLIDDKEWGAKYKDNWLRDLLDAVFEMSIRSRLVFMISFTLLEIYFYVNNQYFLVIYLFLLNIYFLLEVFYAAHHYLSFTQYDLKKVYSHIYIPGKDKLNIVDVEGVDANGKKITVSQVKNEDNWRRSYEKKILFRLSEITSSVYYDTRKKHDYNNREDIDMHKIVIENMVSYFNFVKRFIKINNAHFHDFIVYNRLFYYENDLEEILRDYNNNDVFDGPFSKQTMREIIKNIYKTKKYYLLTQEKDKSIDLSDKHFPDEDFYPELLSILKKYPIMDSEINDSLALEGSDRVDFTKLVEDSLAQMPKKTKKKKNTQKKSNNHNKKTRGKSK